MESSQPSVGRGHVRLTSEDHRPTTVELLSDLVYVFTAI